MQCGWDEPGSYLSYSRISQALMVNSTLTELMLVDPTHLPSHSMAQDFRASEVAPLPPNSMMVGMPCSATPCRAFPRIFRLKRSPHEMDSAEQAKVDHSRRTADTHISLPPPSRPPTLPHSHLSHGTHGAGTTRTNTRTHIIPLARSRVQPSRPALPRMSPLTQSGVRACRQRRNTWHRP